MERWITRLSLPLRQVIRQRCSIMHRLQELPSVNISVIPAVMRWWFMMTFPSRQLLIGKYHWFFVVRPDVRRIRVISFTCTHVCWNVRQRSSRKKKWHAKWTTFRRAWKVSWKVVVHSRLCLSLRRRQETFRHISRRTWFLLPTDRYSSKRTCLIKVSVRLSMSVFLYPV